MVAATIAKFKKRMKSPALAALAGLGRCLRFLAVPHLSSFLDSSAQDAVHAVPLAAVVPRASSFTIFVALGLQR